MILRSFILMIAMTASLTASPASKYDLDNLKANSNRARVNTCNSCRQKPSEAELFLQVQSILNGNILFSPLLRPQINQQL